MGNCGRRWGVEGKEEGYGGRGEEGKVEKEEG